MEATPKPDAQPLRALIADDERLLREQLRTRLGAVWSELEICGLARDGLEAVRMAEELRPDVVFLDIRMPGMTGIEAAREIVALDNWQGQLVFVTAYDEYAVTAFEQGALDYLLKPVEPARLEVTKARVLQRLKGRTSIESAASDAAPAGTGALMQTLLTLQRQLNAQQDAPRMRWLQCSSGQTTRMVAVDDILFFRSDEKYTRVQTREQEFLIRTPIRELVPQLDEQQFWQIHRSTIVNLAEIAAVHRDETGKQRVSLKHHTERLEVSRSFSQLFKHQ
jgi:DNA-binding LytR/AlgR family response regulator